jgi:branched-chain amino acid transport system substrate-binding protein
MWFWPFLPAAFLPTLAQEFSMKKFRSGLLGIGLIVAACAAQAQAKPAELKIAITTFLSGPAAVFGVAGKAAAELTIDEVNAAGGIDGVKLKPIILDEGVGGDKLLSEYRRLVQDEGVKVSLGSVSSGNCNILAPVAEDLKVLNLLWQCGTEKVLENRRYKYVVRPATNSTSDMVAAVMHLLRTKPNFKTVAVVNQDYSFGRDSWEIFAIALKALKPDVQFVAEMFPKFGATDFSSEISRLQALSPDVIVSTSWGGELDTLIRQASQRGLMKSSTWVLPLGENSLERVGKAIPDGVIVGMRGDHYFLDPEFKDDPEHKSFVDKYRAKTGQYPIFPAFQAVVGVRAVVEGYKAAIKANGGKWPSTEQVADEMHKFKFRALGRTITMREDGQGLQDELLGMTQATSAYPFSTLQGATLYPGDLVQAPVGIKAVDWAKTLKTDMLKDPRIKTFAPTIATK